jgi:hypothetical protein
VTRSGSWSLPPATPAQAGHASRHRIPAGAPADPARNHRSAQRPGEAGGSGPAPPLAALPAAPPPDGSPWCRDDPRGRGPVLVPGRPACLYDISPPGAIYRPLRPAKTALSLRLALRPAYLLRAVVSGAGTAGGREGSPLRELLAVILVLQYAHTCDLRQLDEAVDLLRAELARTPETGYDRPSVLHGLACALAARHAAQVRLPDLAGALDLMRRALHALPDDDASLTMLRAARRIAAPGGPSAPCPPSISPPRSRFRTSRGWTQPAWMSRSSCSGKNSTRYPRAIW